MNLADLLDGNGGGDEPRRPQPRPQYAQADATGYPTRVFPKNDSRGNFVQNVLAGLDPTFGGLSSAAFGDPARPSLPIQLGAGMMMMIPGGMEGAAKAFRLVAENPEEMYKLLGSLSEDELKQVSAHLAKRSTEIAQQPLADFAAAFRDSPAGNNAGWSTGLEEAMSHIADRAIDSEHRLRQGLDKIDVDYPRQIISELLAGIQQQRSIR